MKIVIPGGSGHVGACLRRHFIARGDEVVVLSRSSGDVQWDACTLGPWIDSLDRADVVINLAGQSVNCRYNAENIRQMMDSRVNSTRILGQAISTLKNPPRVWLQSSTATIYADRYDHPNDEFTGTIGGTAPSSPKKWVSSVEIALAWEAELEKATTPNTRKVAMRSAMTMSPDKGSIFEVLCGLTRRGLGGAIGGGQQFISWIHEVDFCRALDFIIESETLSGPINLAAPNPLHQSDFQQILRKELGVKIGLPATKWMAEIGAVMMRTETELIFKSRRVVPGILLKEGFKFRFPEWSGACRDLVTRLKP